MLLTHVADAVLKRQEGLLLVDTLNLDNVSLLSRRQPIIYIIQGTIIVT